MALHKSQLNEIGKKIGVTKYEDWYKVTVKQVDSIGGSRLLKSYGGSLYKALQTIYTEYPFYPWMFERVPVGYWDDLKNQRRYFDWLATKLGITQLDQWYNITQEDLINNYGAGILKKHHNNLKKALIALYPERTWHIWLFKQVPAGHWDSIENVKEYVEWLSKTLQISKQEDWYSLSHEEIARHGGATLLLKHGGMSNLLKAVYPLQQWDFLEGNRSTWNKTQNFLAKSIQEVLNLKESDIQHNYKHPSLRSAHSLRPMEYDIYIPSLSLAFEYQGEHHYQFHYLYGDPVMHQQRDDEKRRISKQIGVTLIEVPYWWDREKPSLIATIHKYLPHLVKTSSASVPIPDKDPLEHALKLPKIQFLAPVHWSQQINPTGWWIGKYGDGLRVMWNGTHFVTENGMIHLPLSKNFSGLPKGDFDGYLRPANCPMETFLFSLSQNVVDWDATELTIVDTPSQPTTFEKRRDYLHTLTLPARVKLADFVKCTGVDHFQQLTKGSSRIFLHEPHSYYEYGISPTLIKVERYPEEQVKVLLCREQSIQCERYNGQAVNVRRSDHAVPSPNSIITMRTVAPNEYEMVNLRPDLSWDNVLAQRYPYYLSLGKSRGVPKCYSCKLPLENRSQARVEVDSFFIPQNSKVPYPTTYHFCPKFLCISRAAEGQVGSSGTRLPKFDGVVFIPSSLRDTVQDQLSAVAQGLNFVPIKR